MRTLIRSKECRGHSLSDANEFLNFGQKFLLLGGLVDQLPSTSLLSPSSPIECKLWPILVTGIFKFGVKSPISILPEMSNGKFVAASHLKQV